MVSELFDPAAWRDIDGFDFTDISYHRAVDQGTVRVAFKPARGSKCLSPTYRR